MVEFIAGLFIGAVAGVAVMSLLLLRKRGMSYDKGRKDR
jgi:hypothetical protein